MLLGFKFLYIFLNVLMIRRRLGDNVAAQLLALYQPGPLIDQHPKFKDQNF